MNLEELLTTNLFNLSLIFIQLILIYFLSASIQSKFFYIVKKIFISEKITIYIVAIFFGIGTIIHELSHAVVSLLVGGRVGSISLLPSKLEDGTLKYGHAEVEVLDPVRNSIVGIAPFVVGALLIIYLSNFISILAFDWLSLLAIFLIFQISNSMYLSPSDLVYFKKIIIFSFVFILFILLGEYFLYDFFINYYQDFINFFWSNSLKNYLDKINFAFLFPLLINTSVWVVFRIFVIPLHKRY